LLYIKESVVLLGESRWEDMKRGGGGGGGWLEVMAPLAI
jgi:hypothetical protein